MEETDRKDLSGAPAIQHLLAAYHNRALFLRLFRWQWALL